MKLSKRMECIASLVTPGVRVADIGCDHGYLPISLCMEGKVPSALAMDIRPGPLKAAQANIIRYGLEDRIRTRLSDGMKELVPGEADAAILAGMGGRLIVKILSDSAGVARSLKELILGPQSEVGMVREWLEENGFLIDREEMILEEGKFYPLIHGSREAGSGAAGKRMTEEERLYGPVLLQNRDPVLRRYLEKERKNREELLARMAENRGERAEERRKTLEEEMRLIQAALAYYDM
jgi:tRNA (adenine22-N1)-methyltransferase